MNFEYEIWKVDTGIHKIYIDKKSVLNGLMKVLEVERPSATYLKKGKPVGWDLWIPQGKLMKVKQLLKEYKKR